MVKVREVIHGVIAGMVERGVSLPVGQQRFPYGSRELGKPFAVPAVVPIVALVHGLVCCRQIHSGQDGWRRPKQFHTIAEKLGEAMAVMMVDGLEEFQTLPNARFSGSKPDSHTQAGRGRSNWEAVFGVFEGCCISTRIEDQNNDKI